MAGFIKLNRDKAHEFIAHPMAFHLLFCISLRARRSDSIVVYGNTLSIGECFLGDYKSMGMTEQNYRTAKKRLSDCGFVEFRSTNKGTIAKLIDYSVFDPNFDEKGNGQGNGQPNGQCNGQKNNTVTDSLTSNANTENIEQAYIIEDFETKPNGQCNGQKNNAVTDTVTDSLTDSLTTNKECLKNVIKNDNQEVPEKKFSGSLFPELEMKDSGKKILFADSVFIDFEKFEKKLSGADFENVDKKYYYDALRLWSSRKGEKRCNWIDEAISWMRKEGEEGKLKTLVPVVAELSAREKSKLIAEAYFKNR